MTNDEVPSSTTEEPSSLSEKRSSPAAAADGEEPHSQLVCPFTLKRISEIPSHNVGVVYRSYDAACADVCAVDCDEHDNDNGDADGGGAENDGGSGIGGGGGKCIGCGHRCTLSHLVGYVLDGNSSSSGGGATSPISDNTATCSANLPRGQIPCPVCLDSPIGAISDADATVDGKRSRMVAFRYGAISYRLCVDQKSTAQRRIGAVLGMHATKGLKVIHKGKVIHPTKNTASEKDASEQMLDISAADAHHNRKKPSLVVMGLRIANGPNALGVSDIYSWSFRSLIPALYHTFSRTFVWGWGWILIRSCVVGGGVVLFFRSIWRPPEGDHRRSE